MNRKIHVVYAHPDEPARVLHIIPTVETFRRLVAGPHAVTSSPWPDLIVYVNDTGRRDGLPFNQTVGVNQVYGPFVITKTDSEGDAADLSHEEVADVVSALIHWRIADEDAEAYRASTGSDDKKDVPDIIARKIETDYNGTPRGEWTGNRASTRHVHTAQNGFWGNNGGRVEVSIFESVSDADHGGLVLRFEADTIEDFIPFAKLTRRGVELHLGGQWEAEAHLRALVEVLQKRPPKEEPDRQD